MSPTFDLIVAFAVDHGNGIVLVFERRDAIAQWEGDGEMFILIVALAVGLVVDQGGLDLAN